MKKKRKGCRNCQHSRIIRFPYAFPWAMCMKSEDTNGWDGCRYFHDCCDKHEWRTKDEEDFVILKEKR